MADEDDVRDEDMDVEFEEYNDDEYEEIDTAEIDSVITGLRALMEGTTSETIKSYLADTIADIEYLAEESGMYAEDDDEQSAAA